MTRTSQTGWTVATAAAVAVAAACVYAAWHRRRGSGPSGRARLDRPLAEEDQMSAEERWRERQDRVDEALEESFPASDPPSYTPGHAGPPRH